MTRAPAIGAVLLALAAGAVDAQARPGRSSDYLFAATARDARALWVNPAGLAAVVEAAVMGELIVDRPPIGDMRVAQYSFGFNSRGLAFGYQRDRFRADSIAGTTYRLGVAQGTGEVSGGVTMALYRGGGSATGFDAGMRFSPPSVLSVALLIRNISRPVVRDTILRLSGVGGLALTGHNGRWQVAAEARAAERSGSGYDMTYAAGAGLRTSGPRPVGVLAVLDLGRNLKIDRWSVGLTVGGTESAVLVGTAHPVGGSARLTTVSLSGVATRELLSR